MTEERLLKHEKTEEILQLLPVVRTIQAVHKKKV